MSGSMFLCTVVGTTTIFLSVNGSGRVCNGLFWLLMNIIRLLAPLSKKKVKPSYVWLRKQIWKINYYVEFFHYVFNLF
ncbi:hypothetical protein RchiOBHm_Chr5g0035961 [Rosa chinensis]|uniref:Uncharacterized protein n=1 Tax=Rosa chinensis TaxID=74649 RepID=A0A2P6QBD5_ROSCH|nr:hypothetical protein RchiOBHm_Chr5g0035961 [Rosa chinensis]